MTFAELDDALPNGLHDAYLKNIAVCFKTRTAELELALIVDLEGTKPIYKDASIRLSGLWALVIDGPDVAMDLDEGVRIDSFVTNQEQFSNLSTYSPEVRRLFHSLYLFEPWNSFVHIAAESAAVRFVGWEDRANQK